MSLGLVLLRNMHTNVTRACCANPIARLCMCIVHIYTPHVLVYIYSVYYRSICIYTGIYRYGVC